MKVSISWLKQLVDLKIPVERLVELLPLRTIGTKEVTEDFIELDMKGYNRADLLSMHGVALEVAAIIDSNVKFADPNPEDYVWLEQNFPKVDITETDKVASVYCVAKIEGLKVKKSPEDWVKKLNDSGMRSVNNVTDITNLAMLKYGQPMHAFDGLSVQKNMNVEFCWDATTHYMTLDHKLKSIEHGDILIRGDGKIIGLGGIMGGKNSEVTDKTTSIILEAAIFDPIQIRKTATRLGLQSEASKRFYHGLTKKRLLQALDAAIKMYQEMGGKLTAITLIGDFDEQPKIINLAAEKVRNLIGVEIKDPEIEEYLKKLYFDLRKTQNGWEVTVPYWRLDIEIEEDLIEEVARMYGYEKIPSEKVPEQKSSQPEDPIFDLIYKLKSALADSGLYEVQTYSFYSTAVLENLNWEKNNLVKIANPISAETEYLREDLWPNLLEVISKNSRQGYSDIAIFEIGKVYGQGKDQPTEDYRLSLALYDCSDNPAPKLYQLFQTLGLHLRGVKLSPESKMGEYEKKYFHPKRFAFLNRGKKAIGGIAEVHLRYTDNFGIKGRVAVLEIELDSL